MESHTNEYSGSLHEGWNHEGSYQRLQFYTSELLDESQIISLLQEGIQSISTSGNDRLDIRANICEDFNELIIQESFPSAQIVTRNTDSGMKLLCCLNFGERIEAEGVIDETRDFVRSRIRKVFDLIDSVGGFESYALAELDRLRASGYCFEGREFSVEEVYTLWSSTFDWSRDDIESFIQANTNSDRMYGLRNSSGELQALMMVGEDYESTEWAVNASQQGNGLIEPLLIIAHSLIVQFGNGNQVYAHMRYNRSVSAGLKAGMRITQSQIENILINHVKVDGQFTHFVEGELDLDIYTPEFIERVLEFIN